MCIEVLAAMTTWPTVLKYDQTPRSASAKSTRQGPTFEALSCDDLHLIPRRQKLRVVVRAGQLCGRDLELEGEGRGLRDSG